MKTADITVAVVKLKGDAKRGEQLFTQQGCIACHTVKVTDPLSGPYLGNIANTYQRSALAEAILEPSKNTTLNRLRSAITFEIAAWSKSEGDWRTP